MSLVVNEANRVIIFRITGTSGSSLKPPLILSIYRSVHHTIPARDEDRLVERKQRVFKYVRLWSNDLTFHQGDGLLPQATGISTQIYRVANGTWASSSINPEIGTHFCWIRTCQWAAPASKGFRVQPLGPSTFIPQSGSGTSLRISWILRKIDTESERSKLFFQHTTCVYLAFVCWCKIIKQQIK